jgi:hypothetical protein
VLLSNNNFFGTTQVETKQFGCDSNPNFDSPLRNVNDVFATNTVPYQAPSNPPVVPAFAPPTFIDDDPFDMHVSRPMIAVAPSLPVVPLSTGMTTNTHNAKSSLGPSSLVDPFSTLVSLKPQPMVTAVLPQTAMEGATSAQGLTLNSLMLNSHRLAMPSLVVPNSLINSQAAVDPDDDPYEIHLRPASLNSAPASVATQISTVSPSAHLEPFFASPTGHAAFDPFGTTPSDFDGFSKDNTNTVAFSTSDFDILESRPALNSIVPLHDPFASQSQVPIQHSVTADVAPSDPDFDFFNNLTVDKQVKVVHQDPFSIGFDDADPFSNSAAATAKKHDQASDFFDDDGFGVFDKHSLHGADDDPMKKLRQVYQLHEDNQSDADMDDDLDNYDSKYLQSKTRTAAPSM